MILSWFRKPKIVTEVAGDKIIVTMPGTSFRVAYEKTQCGQLVASSFSGRTSESGESKITFPKFLALAWTAANDKARELGWII
jgi:hypothetical protein